MSAQKLISIDQMHFFEPADILDMRHIRDGRVCISVRTQAALRGGDLIDLGRYSRWQIIEVQDDPTPGVVTLIAVVDSTSSTLA